MSLQNAILGLINYSPKSGYDLKIVFDKSINHFWPASLSQIYRELGILEKRGSLTSVIQTQEERPDKKIYTITEKGKKEFTDWLSDFPVVLQSSKRDEFMVRIFFGSNLDNKELIQQLESYLKERLSSQKALSVFIEHFESGIAKGSVEENKTNEAKYWRFTIRMAELSNQAQIEWAKECIKKLTE